MKKMNFLKLTAFSILICFATSCKKDSTAPLVDEEPKEDSEIPDPEPIVTKIFDNADFTDGWEHTGAKALNSDKKEGASSLKFTVTSGTNLSMQKKLARPITTQLTKETAQLNFWLWIEDISNLDLSAGQIEISSSGKSDVNEFGWGTSELKLVNGWNEVKLKVSNASPSGDGGANLDAINFFRMQFKLKAEASSPFSVAVDEVKFVVAEADPEPVDIMLLDACDDGSGWDKAIAAELILNTIDKKVGSGALNFIFKNNNADGSPILAGSSLMFRKTFTTPLDTKLTFDNGKLKFWLWINKASDIDWAATNSQIEISSSGAADLNELHWFPSQILNPKDGWNEIELKFSDGEAQGGTIDLTRVNFFRMYLRAKVDVSSENPLAIGIDHLKFEK